MQYDEESEKKRQQAEKKEKLAKYEEVSAIKAAGGEQPKGFVCLIPSNFCTAKASWATQILAKIVDNLQIKITKIHIRYEGTRKDNSVPVIFLLANCDKPFAFGITLDSALLLSTDENFVHKLIRTAVEQLRYKVLEKLGYFHII